MVARGRAAPALDLLRTSGGAVQRPPHPFLARAATWTRSEARCRLALGDVAAPPSWWSRCRPPAAAVETLARLDLAQPGRDRAAERLLAAAPRRGSASGSSASCCSAGPAGSWATNGAVTARCAAPSSWPARAGFSGCSSTKGAELAAPLTRIGARSGDAYVAELFAHTATPRLRFGDGPARGARAVCRARAPAAQLPPQPSLPA